MNAETEELLEEFMAETGLGASEWRPSWNVAPTEQVPVIRQRDGKRELTTVRWSMVSASSPTFGGGKPVFNARIESVATNGLFTNAFASRRCLVPASGYYEWQLQESGKQPYYIHPEDERKHLAMAGVIGAWRDRSRADDDPERWRLSMAIITRAAHLAPGEVHDRMPALLTPDAFDDWLGEGLPPDDLLALLEYSSQEATEALRVRAVSTAVNSSKNKGPEIIEPIG
jgi:putative SOS response-associated peptidase YedK